MTTPNSPAVAVPDPAGPDAAAAQTPPAALSEQPLPDSSVSDAQSQAAADDTLRPAVPSEASPDAGAPETSDPLAPFDKSKAVPLPKDSTLVEVTARVCRIDGALYDLEEDYCYHLHEGSSRGDEQPLNEPEGAEETPEGSTPGSTPAGPGPEPTTPDTQMPAALENPQLESGSQVVPPVQGEPAAAQQEVTS